MAKSSQYYLGFRITLRTMPRHNKNIPHIPLQRSSSCDEKRRFRTEKHALAAAEYQSLLTLGLELRVYKCPHCSGWHLTNSSKK